MAFGRRCLFGLILFWLFSHDFVRAAGTGLNVLVVVNGMSPASVEVGNYYCERRSVPPQNYLRIHWPGGNSQWTLAEFNQYLRQPIIETIRSRGLTNQIDYVLLCSDIPYRVVETGSVETAGRNSTTSALFYGFKPDGPAPEPGLPVSCALPAASSNSYAASERLFRDVQPYLPGQEFFLASMLTSSNVALAKQIIDQGVAADGSLPAQTVYLAKSIDPFRNVRYWLFDNVLFNARILGGLSIVQTNLDTVQALGNPLGYLGGRASFGTTGTFFVPGAMADQLTSYGGILYEPNDQTSLLAFLAAGASGSYGTVVEPCSYLEKFPSGMNYFYQARGFTLIESYYQSVANPYQGLLVGEPLSAPFAIPSRGGWVELPNLADLSGTTNLSVEFNGFGPRHPVQRIDVFLDGTYLKTITNRGPVSGNRLEVSFRDHAFNYVVPSGATLAGVAQGLADRLNQPDAFSSTGIKAFACGDRVELQGWDVNVPGSGISLSASSSSSGVNDLTTSISASGASLLDTRALGVRSYAITNIPSPGDILALLVTKTNGQAVRVSVTNTSGTMTLSQLATALVSAANNHPELMAADGVLISDVNMHEDYIGVYDPDDHSGEFNIRARSPGWPESQIRVWIDVPDSLEVKPTGTNALDENVDDLRPRAHLYLGAGVFTNLSAICQLDTATLADGHHQLEAVAREGTHAGTQTRAAQAVIIRNTSLTASLDIAVGGTNAAVESSLEFAVTSSGGEISSIQLYSTGGQIQAVSDQPQARFTVRASDLGVGLHSLYALVTAGDGRQFRTQTRTVRVVSQEPPFSLSFASPPLTLAWPATFGRIYEIFAGSQPANATGLVATLTATNTAGRWTDTNSSLPQRFYRVRAQTQL